MLKIALPTFKNDENHTQNSKIHTQNSVCKVRCDENDVRRWRKYGAKTAKWWCIFGVYMLGFLYFGCQGGEMVVRLRRLVVRKWRLVVWLRGFSVWFLYDLVVDAAFGNL